MEQLINELRKHIQFQDSTDVGDIVLIAAKKPQMLVYALVQSIERDPSRRDEWWQVRMVLLAVPPQQITWTLRTPQMTGMEVFTMGGEERFCKAILLPSVAPSSPPAPERGTGKLHQLKRVK